MNTTFRRDNTLRELMIFLVVGVSAVAIDFACYKLLLWAGNSVNNAKACSFLTGTIFAYFANRLWTFGHRQHSTWHSLWRFGALYASTLTVNVGVNAVALGVCKTLGAALPAALLVAYLTATGTSATMNFVGMKWFVFKTVKIPEPT